MTLRRRPILWFVLLALLATRAVVPSGWMPVAGSDGVKITLCTGQGLVVATLDAQGNVHPGEPAHEGPRETCPYGTLAHAAGLPVLPALAAPILHIVPPSQSATVQLVATLHAPRPPTRGPPALV
ncbi:MAG TPA: DUF2946 family protein [Sphingomonadaceae bacterium]|nr:DUF2946 family protein [Sphingomonadaceae bacterium]